MRIPFALVPYLIEKYSLGGTGGAILLNIVGVILCILIPYLLGSLNFGIIVSRALFKEDVRDYGSGNSGSTNILRSYGIKAAVLTFLGDFLKGALSVVIGMLILQTSVETTGGFVLRPIGGWIASFFVVFGHMFPVYFHFRGGKGIASAAGTIAVTSPLTLGILVLIFLVIVVGTKYVSLGSVMVALIYPFLISRLDRPVGINVIMALMTGLFIIFMHRDNIKRLWEGTESKVSFRNKGAREQAAKTDTKKAGREKNDEK